MKWGGGPVYNTKTGLRSCSGATAVRPRRLNSCDTFYLEYAGPKSFQREILGLITILCIWVGALSFPPISNRDNENLVAGMELVTLMPMDPYPKSTTSLVLMMWI